jgi:hypothetical protein
MSDPTSLESLLALPDANGGLASILLILGGLAGAGYAGAVAASEWYAGAVAASEWSWNTFRMALTRGESRVRYTVVLFLAMGLLVLAAWILLCLFGVGLIRVAATLGGVASGSPLDASNLGALTAIMVAGGWAVLMEVAVGFCVAFASRSPVAGIATVAGLVFIEQFAALVVPRRRAAIRAGHRRRESGVGSGPDRPRRRRGRAARRDHRLPTRCHRRGRCRGPPVSGPVATGPAIAPAT